MRVTNATLQIIVQAMFLLVPLSFTTAADWPQWGGPSRNFQVDSPPLADSWSNAGPLRLWKRPLGDGYSGMAVVKGRIYTMYRAGNREHIVALDAKTGDTIWEQSYAAPFLPGTNLQPGPGPHSTPLVIGNRVCTTGVTGKLHCLDAANGKILWSYDLIDELKGTRLFRGHSTSLVAYKKTVLAAVGGPGHAVVAFRLKDGGIEWQKQDFQISHASPLLISFEGKTQFVIFANKVIAGLDPDNGELIWQHPQPLIGGHIASMPVWGDDGRLFFSCAYGGGSRCLQLKQIDGKTMATENWYNNKMRVHHSNVIRIGDHVYGSNGDFGPELFMSMNLRTGKIAWRERALGRCSSVYADGKLIVLQEDGQLVLATVSPDRLKIHAKVSLFTSRAWTPPTLVDKQLFIRNREDVMAFELP